MAIICLGIGGIWLYAANSGSHKATIAPTRRAISKPTVTRNIEGKYLFSGTVMLGRAVATYANGDYNQPFSGMASLGTYDAHIGVFECPITTNNVSYQTEVNNLIFNCSPSWVPTLKKYFPILNLSSDHLNDQGSQGITDTFQYLHAGGIQTVGTYNPHTQKDQCNVVTMPINVKSSNGQSSAAALPIAMCSYNYKIVFSPAPGELANIHKWSKIMPVIALMNGGPEYEHIAGSAQVSVAHQMIDEGADFVVGNGTHWVQNTEVYKNKLIVYSMGNFIFDQLDNDGRDALNLSVSMNLADTGNVQKWLQIGASCQSQTSTCAARIASEKLTRVMPHYSFTVVGSYGGYLQVATKATPQEESYIEQRANWASTESILQKGSSY
jgi:poly-gamma-glutamate synthesis protein (capsule biosynthesis protein)